MIPEQIYEVLKSIQLKETLFYFVSKSGGQQRLWRFFSCFDQLKLEGVHEDDWKILLFALLILKMVY